MGFINEHNYEAYFIDYMEQNLNAEEVAELLLFLEENPGLKAELEEFEMVELTPKETSFELKNSLKQTINSESADDFMIASVEGIGTAEDEKELAEYVSSSDEAKKLYSRYQNTKLVAPAIVFPNKPKLKRRNRVVVLYPLMAVAASWMLFIVLNQSPVNDAMYSSESLEEVLIDTTAENPIVPMVNDEFDIVDEVPELAIEEDSPLVPESPKEPLIYDEGPIQQQQMAMEQDSVNEVSPIPLPELDPQIVEAPKDSVPAQPDPIEFDLDEDEGGMLTMTEWANKNVREKVLNEEEPTTEKIKKQEIITAVADRIDQTTEKDVAYNYSENDEYSKYTLSIGKFEFSRTKRKNF